MIDVETENEVIGLHFILVILLANIFKYFNCICILRSEGDIDYGYKIVILLF